MPIAVPAIDETIYISLIMDAWINEVFPAIEIETRLSNGNFGYYTKNDSFDNTELSVSTLDKALQNLQDEGFVAEGIKNKSR